MSTYSKSQGGPNQGRPRDPGRDAVIITTTLNALVRDGFDRLTIEAVALEAGVGKATVYRRWAGKLELAVDAIDSLSPAIDTIDSGSLGGDFELLISACCSQPAQRLLRVMISICSALPREPELLASFKANFVESWTARITEVLVRSQHRGDLRPEIDVTMAASLLSSAMLQQVLITGEPIERLFVEHVLGSLLQSPPDTTARAALARD